MNKPADKPAKTSQEAIEKLFHQALKARATDIHIDSSSSGSRVRFRVDGMLKTVLELSPEELQDMIQNIKILSAMNPEEKNLPQDGRIRYNIEGRPLDIRVSIMPSVYGESAVARILDSTQIRLTMDQMGLTDEHRKQLEGWMGSNWGTVFFTGPTGSGKSTVMYTCLQQIDPETSKICTIEDPVEYTLPGLVQTRIDMRRGFTFPHAMRAVLRADPDVIMVTEIRDKDTADLVFNAALTGHLVMSSLHTSSATEALARLVDIGIKPFIVKSGLRGIVNQRLVRKLCDKCKKEATMSPAQKQELGLPEGTYYEPVGCKECNQVGYRGRRAIYELFELSDETALMLVKGALESEIREQAIKEGMKTLWDDGATKAAAGITSIEELFRVTGGQQ